MKARNSILMLMLMSAASTDMYAQDKVLTQRDYQQSKTTYERATLATKSRLAVEQKKTNPDLSKIAELKKTIKILENQLANLELLQKN